MRKLPIIFILLLLGIWLYTCWYWYTCNIKGFCDREARFLPGVVETTRYIEREDV